MFGRNGWVGELAVTHNKEKKKDGLQQSSTVRTMTVDSRLSGVLTG